MRADHIETHLLKSLRLELKHLRRHPVVVRADELPGGSGAGGLIPRLTAEQFLAAAPEGRFPELDAARTRQRSSRETLAILRESAERTRREHAEVAAKARRLEAALTTATSGPVAAEARCVRSRRIERGWWNASPSSRPARPTSTRASPS